MSKANIVGVVGVFLLLGAIGALYVMLNRPEKPRSKRVDQVSTSRSPVEDTTDLRTTEQRTPRPTSEAGSESNTAPAATPEKSEKVIEVYSSDGTRIRDYRSGDAPMRNPEAPLRKPLSVTKIEPTLASRMGAELRRVANRCRSEHTAEVGEAAKVQPRATFQVRGGRLLVTDVEISLTNIPSGGGFESCLQSGVLGISVEAADHPDIKEHKLMVPIDFPG